MLNPDAAEVGLSPTVTMLDKVAMALGCSVETFSKTAMGDLAETSELLRLWSMLGHEHDRLKVLSFISTLAFGPDASQSR